MHRKVAQVLLQVLLFVCASSARALPPVSASLPPPVYADTETTTNIPLQSVCEAGRFSFSLACSTTPTNNVEIAFGTDANGDGVLQLEEMELAVGWDCGAWFARKDAAGDAMTAALTVGNTTGTLDWEVLFGRDGVPYRLEIRVDGSAVFMPLQRDEAMGRRYPGWVFSPSWNLMCLTGRGLEASSETFVVQILSDGLAIRFR